MQIFTTVNLRFPQFFIQALFYGLIGSVFVIYSLLLLATNVTVHLPELPLVCLWFISLPISIWGTAKLGNVVSRITSPLHGYAWGSLFVLQLISYCVGIPYFGLMLVLFGL